MDDGRDLKRGETVALPVVVVLLLLIFRGVVALLLPLVVALVAIAGALLILLGVVQVSQLSSYSVNVVTMAGLGLAVDYSLLLVNRFREERAAGLAPPEAIERTLASAGRTVAFSGLTVAVSLAGLLVFAQPLLRSLAWSGIGVVLVAVAAALTLIPALLGLWGRRIRPDRRGRWDHGLFYRQSRLVQRFAVVLVPLLVAGLVLLALPFGHARLENSGPETLPRSSPARQYLETLRDRFPGRGTDPIIVVGEIDPRSPQARAFVARVQALPGSWRSRRTRACGSRHRTGCGPGGLQPGPGRHPTGGRHPRPGAAGGDGGDRRHPLREIHIYEVICADRSTCR